MPRKRQKNKRYSAELKIAVVEAYLSGKGSMAELAKKYGTDDSPAFINGILAKIA